jgi:1,4-dihydroxy-6-naphthoate synthase
MTKIIVAHSPDSDDAFMFYPLAEGKIDTGRYKFGHVLSDIETLNQKALEGVYDVSAISIHAYPYVADRYALLRSGASMGYKYGPVLVSKSPIESIKGKRVAVPGKLTSAYLELQLFEEDFTPVFMKFDDIINAVEKGEIEAGLIIHEGQLTYEEKHLHKVVDLGEWWYEETGLPLPLGGNVIRKDLGDKMREVAAHIKKGIIYSLEHEDEALDYAMRFGGDLDRESIRKFVKMYVNEFTVDYGADGEKAIELLLDMGYEKGIIKKKARIEFV